ncbi:ATP-binding cassette domain-containing protein [Bombilactobacillus folatiphilus]|uniref:ATP-binding cassette domain-containing protein n=1 Tax=Bombilactobacillus folatiphilus TaxID=2923362 RepID=A0ABY4P8E4_9LACO|nr:ATP-binding cassette domain-containing protein [Bombilactobacillus folatiphilus]UQS81964.1 ATP-binding cassette domain-containing protein [Bombilactobacillus folatiphilus]
MNKILIQATDLSMKFEQKIIFQKLSFAIRQGDFFCILGPNGSGKTTLLRIILQQLTPTSGTLKSVVSLRQMGYVPQFRNLDADYPLSAKAFVALKLSHSLRPWLNRQEKDRVQQALAKTHLTAKQNLRLGQMSGGEKQHSYLAQAIVDQPQLLILDEPTASLDEQAKFEVMDVVQELNQQGTTVIFITHDPELLQRYGNSQRLILPGGNN